MRCVWLQSLSSHKSYYSELSCLLFQSGFGIADEMCVNYIHYYPATRLEVCKSSITTKSLYGFFKFLQE